MTSHIFRAPLFGDQAPVSFRLFGSQLFPEGVGVTLWYARGFPSFDTEAGVEVDGIPWGTGQAVVRGGDFRLGAVRPDWAGGRRFDTVAARGVELGRRDEGSEWSVFAAEPRYVTGRFPGEEASPVLVGGSLLRRYGSRWWGFSLIGIEDPLYPTADRPGERDGVGNLSLHQRITPWSLVSGEVSAAARGGFGGRLEWSRRHQVGEIQGSAYAYSHDYPFLYPLLRGGERGLEAAATHKPGEFSTVFGRVNLYEGGDRRERRALRGDLGYARRLLGPGSSLQILYSRNEASFDPLSIARPDVATDRLSLGFSRSSRLEHFRVALEHVMDAGSTGVDRSQLRGLFRRLLGLDGAVSGSFLLQREGSDSRGLTAVAAIEQPLGVSGFHYLVGLGAVLRDRRGERRGEGVARLGASRRLGREGFHLRVEVLLPFGIGLDRAGLRRRQVAVDLGYRLGWRTLDEMRETLVPGLVERQTGIVEGEVVAEGVGLARVPVLLDGVRRAVTDSQGRFRVSRVREGAVVVSLDMSRVDPRISIVGEPFQLVDILPREVQRLSFELAELSYLQGSLVWCRADELVPIAGARLVLMGEATTQEAVTDHMGGFLVDQIQPGFYSLHLDLESLGDEIPVPAESSWRLDLTEDLAGFVLRVNCNSP